MAKIISQTIVITVSKLVKGDGTELNLIDDVTVSSLEEAVSALVADDSVVVEAELVSGE